VSFKKAQARCRLPGKQEKNVSARICGRRRFRKRGRAFAVQTVRFICRHGSTKADGRKKILRRMSSRGEFCAELTIGNGSNCAVRKTFRG
jgi:hypothetical protein